MHTLLLSYDLITPGRDYDTLYEFLKSFGTRAKPLESVYLIKTEFTAKQMRDQLSLYVDTNDKLLVIDVSGDGAAWRGLPDNLSTWIKNNL